MRDISVPALLAPERLPISFYTFEPAEFWAEPRDSWWLGVSDWVIRQERQHGPTVQSLGAWADRTLSGSSQALPNNESYLRLGFAAESEYSDPAQFEPELRFRLDVPTAEEKLRLVVESESEELIPLAERERDRQLTEPERTDTETTGALRFLTDIGDSINLSTDIGGRLRLPPELFWRMKARKGWKIDRDWTLNTQQRLYYYHTEGWGARSWIGLDRSLGNGWHYYNSSELEWVHSDRKFVAAHVHSIQKRLNTRSVVTPRVGILGESQPTWRTTSYFADVTWRYRMYSNWLFAELIPALEYQRDEGFDDQASIVFRIEMYFAGTIDRE
ncbi:hypothetical protein [Marinobacter nauticus]|uniref:hypothetical protein n=1 Tax=Marinobacter nauticus TaxID=2743 RepID=UPI003735B6B1